MTTEIQIPAFTGTCLMVTAAICIVAVFVAWYTVRGRVKLSQIILGVFCYILVMLLENVLDLLAQTAGLPMQGLGYGVYIVLSVVLARELLRFGGMRFGLRGRYSEADSALGFAIGFAGTYLLICGAYYFSCYSTVRAVLGSGVDAFLAEAGTDAEAARGLLETIAAQSGLQFVVTGINRVFFLVREMALCVLLWYAMERDSDRIWYWMVPLLHLAAMIPDGLYQAELMASSYTRDIATCVISGGIIFLAARIYNAREDQVTHYQVEHLRARKR